MIFPDWAFFVARDPTSVVEGGDGGNPLRGAAAAAALYFGPSPTSNPPHPFPPHPSPSIHSAPSPSEGNLKKVQTKPSGKTTVYNYKFLYFLQS